MKVIIGLGNPGTEYENTRHNVGFMAIDKIAEKISNSNFKKEFKGEVATGYIGSEKIFLLKPQTFMNLSGEAVSEIMNFYKLSTEDIIVIYDDMDTEVGSFRIRKKGSAGGHNGIKSIIQHLKREDFPRIRIGIGRPSEHFTVVKYVLSNFTSEEKTALDTVLNKINDITTSIIKDGLDIAMNKYNPKKIKKKVDTND